MEAVSALKVGCGKFFHGEGVISLLAVSAHNFRKKRAFFVKGATVATKCINKSRTILKRSSGSSLLVLA